MVYTKITHANNKTFSQLPVATSSYVYNKLLTNKQILVADRNTITIHMAYNARALKSKLLVLLMRTQRGEAAVCYIF